MIIIVDSKNTLSNPVRCKKNIIVISLIIHFSLKKKPSRQNLKLFIPLRLLPRTFPYITETKLAL